MARANFAADCGAAEGDRRLDNSTDLCVGNAEDDQEGLHEHVSNQFYTQADRDDDNVQSVHWLADGGDGRQTVIRCRSD